VSPTGAGAEATATHSGPESAVSVYLVPSTEVQAILSEAGLSVESARQEPDRVVLRLTAEAAPRAVALLRAAFGDIRVAAGDENLARRVAASLAAARATLALAESCTGGLVAKLLTDAAGSSAFMLGGVVAYANDAKVRLLGVSPDAISRHGAVSAEVAEAMARGAARAFGARVSAAVSGIAGPDGGTAEKPVGTVWVAVGGPGREYVTRHFLFDGGRERIRDLAASNVLLMLEALARTLAPAARQGGS